jgi:hypothetical protein
VEVKPDDLRQHKAFVTRWEAHPSAKALERSYATIKHAAESGKGNDGLSGLGKAGGFLLANQEALLALDELGEEFGGLDVVFMRGIKLIALTSAAKSVAGEGGDPASDKVADELVSGHAKAREEYEQQAAARREAMRTMMDPETLRAIQEDPEARAKLEEKNKELSSAGEWAPGKVLWARLPEQSLKSWRQLSVKERRELIEHARLPATPFFMALPGQQLNDETLGPALAMLELTRGLEVK